MTKKSASSSDRIIQRESLGHRRGDNGEYIARVASLIPAGSIIADIGIDLPGLKSVLPVACRQLRCETSPADHDRQQVFADTNWLAANGPFDLILALGLLEDTKSLLENLKVLRSTGATVIVDGRIEPPDGFDAVRVTIEASDFRISRTVQLEGRDALVKLEPAVKIASRAPRKVVVLSYSNFPNFGDRIGIHLLNQILPSHAEVTYCTIAPWSVPTDSIDLLILGIGNSLFHDSFHEQLLPTVRNANRCIGIFGTQYREKLPVAELNELIAMLDIWHARYQEDIFLHGRQHSCVRHLGDWVISACAMTRWTQPEPFYIDLDFQTKMQSLDRQIERFQAHRIVFSKRLHPLICALTSAEAVGYGEQHLPGTNIASGKFRSMLMDIFDREYPADMIWPVDRSSVRRYRDRVCAGIVQLRRDLDRLLE